MNHETERWSVMMKARLLFLLLIFTELVFGQCPEYDTQPPSLSNVVVRALAIQNQVTQILSYRYSVANGISSTGCINRFEVDLSFPENGNDLSDSGLTDYPRYVDRTALRLNPELRIIPVGVPSLPTYKGFTSAWFAGFGVNKRIDWVRAIASYRIEPGDTLLGITMISHGLPGLRAFVISPSYEPVPPVIVTPENEDSVYLNVPPLTQEEEEAFQRLLDSIKVRGTTIGPTAPPATFNALTFLDTIASYVSQSRTLGWITTQAAANKYTALIDSAQSHLAVTPPQRGIAKAKLDSVLLNVHPDSTAGLLTSEAYALLRFNTEYVLTKLREEDSDHQEEGKTKPR